MWLWCHLELDVEDYAWATHSSTPDCQESNFMREQIVVLHLHDIRMSFCTGAVPRVNLHGFDSLQYEILCWYHVNKYRSIRGHWSEPVPEWKSCWYHVNTPLEVEDCSYYCCCCCWFHEMFHCNTSMINPWVGTSIVYINIYCTRKVQSMHERSCMTYLDITTWITSAVRMRVDN